MQATRLFSLSNSIVPDGARPNKKENGVHRAELQFTISNFIFLLSIGSILREMALKIATSLALLLACVRAIDVTGLPSCGVSRRTTPFDLLLMGLRANEQLGYLYHRQYQRTNSLRSDRFFLSLRRQSPRI